MTGTCNATLMTAKARGNVVNRATTTKTSRACDEMRASRHLLPAVQIDAEEDGLEKEREAFERERHPDERASALHEARPQEAELEAQHRAGDRADREQDRRALRPSMREIQVNGVAAFRVEILGDDHEHRHRHTDDGEHDVEAERHGHLQPCSEQIRHAQICRRDRRNLPLLK